MSYTKLFSSIVTSTIWTEDAETCKIWVTMLALANKDGEVLASIPGLAQIAGLPVSVTESAINKFLSPDKYSRSQDDEGRRIEPVKGGWVLLNHTKYRAMDTDDDRKSKAAERKRRYRDQLARNGGVPDQTRDNVGQDGTCPKMSHQISQADTDTDTEAELFPHTSETPPLPPKGEQAGDLRILPKGWEKMNETKRNRVKVNVNSKQMIRIGRWFGRRESTLWTVAETVALKDVRPPEEDILFLEKYYGAVIEEESDHRRRNLITLLNNWTGEVDRARVYCQSHGIKIPKPQPTP